MNPIDRLIDLALDEDIGPGDLTTDALLPSGTNGRAVILAKQTLILCGNEIVSRVYEKIDGAVVCRSHASDGDRIAAGTTVMTLDGPMDALLRGERTALNFLQRLSGIATHVNLWVAALGEGRTRLVDTRKTTPGWRVIEKYAVRIGGAANHRMGLYDGILIKDNHIAACGGIQAAVARARRHASHMVKIEVEVSDMNQVDEALAAGIEVIMLDNMNLDQVRTAVAHIAGRAIVEVSGGVAMGNLSALAATGVDLISAGALTHQARAVDLSMRLEAC